MKSRIATYFLIAATTLIGCRASEITPSVATVGPEIITEAAYRSQYGEYLITTGLPDSPTYRQRVLDTMIGSSLLVQEAREAELDLSPQYLEAERRATQKLLIEGHLHRAIYDTIQISEDELQALFVRANTTWSARHLATRSLPDANALRARLNRGASFEALAREIFQDPRLRDTGGFLGEFAFDEMDPAFEDALEELKVGEISGPVRTATGYSIIKLENRTTKPLITETEYASKRDNMMQLATVRRRNAARQVHLQDILDRLDTRFHAGAFGDVMESIIDPDADLARQESEGLPNQVLAETTSRTWTVRELQNAAEYTTKRQQAAVRDSASLADFFTGLIAREEMIRLARSESIDDSDAFKQALREEMDDWVLDEWTRRLYENMTIPPDTVRAFYDRYATEFELPVRIRVREIVLESREGARQMMDSLKTKPFDLMARRHSLRAEARQTGGDLGLLTRDQLGVHGDKLFDARMNQILGPLPMDDRFIILRREGKAEARTMTLEEAAPEIIRRLKESDFKRTLHEHVTKLRTQSVVTADTSKVQQLPLTSTRT